MKLGSRLVRYFVMLLAACSLAAAQQNASSVLKLHDDVELGQYLTDADGRSLYLNLDDAAGAACTAGCLNYWPPFTSDQVPEAAEGVDAALIGLQQDAAGNSQVTYAGWPLHYFGQDRTAGSVRGQGVAEVWFLVSPSGEPAGISAQEAHEEPAEGVAVPETAEQIHDESLFMAMEQGSQVYTHACATCHGPEGEGGIGIRLVENPLLAKGNDIADAVTNGRGYMPALGIKLTDGEIAAALTFVRNSWGNLYGPVTEEVVQSVRK